MLNSEYYKLRYRIPSLVFLSPPSQTQEYSVYITKQDPEIPNILSNMDSYSWVSIGKCFATKEGNVFSDINKKLPFEIILGYSYGNSSKNITINPFTDYILKFVNITDPSISSIHYSLFSTGLNIGLFYSPYKNRVLLPEQSYSINYDVQACGNLPSKNDLNWFFYINDGKFSESLYLTRNGIDENGNTIADNDNWASLMPTDSSIIDLDYKTQKCIKINDIVLGGAKIHDSKYFSLPHTHVKDNTYGYYWNSARQLYQKTDIEDKPIEPLKNVTGERGRDGVGGIRANDIATIGSALGFAFYVDENEVTRGEDGKPVLLTLCSYDISALKARKPTSFKIYIDHNMHLKVYASENNEVGLWTSDIASLEDKQDVGVNLFKDTPFEDTPLTYNTWYYLVLGPKQSLYTILDEDHTSEPYKSNPIQKYGIKLLAENTLSPFASLQNGHTEYKENNIIPQSSFFPGSSYLKTNPGIEGKDYAFWFGGKGFSGLYLSGIGGVCKSADSSGQHATDNVITAEIVSKVLRPDIYIPILKIIGYKDGIYTDEIIKTKYINTSLNNSKGEITFYINSNSYNDSVIKAIEKDDLKYLVVRVLNNKDKQIVINQKFFAGYKSGYDVQDSAFPITQYLQDSFTLNFKDIYDTAYATNPDTAEQELIKQLSSIFVTKHGTWGGYNGGCNGHLLYFDSNKNLVMEAHGDDYIPYGDNPSDKSTAQHPFGIGKENIDADGHVLYVDDQTGYGSSVFWDNFEWDKRKYKNYLRTGTSLVSNKYFTYGRVDVTMKIPKLKVGHNDFGICPALWFFHYVEIYPDSDRYTAYPFEHLAIEGSDEIGYYKVLNNEIDIELPSHLINGKSPNFDSISQAFFASWEEANLLFDYKELPEVSNRPDKVLIDDQSHITVNNVLYRYKGRGNDPTLRDSWIEADYGRMDTRCFPSFRNCKFNMWIGEYNSGDGWTSTKQAYFDPYYRENYQSMLTRVADNWYGYADNAFHKWSIVWTPTKTVLLIDDVPFRIGRGYIPVNVMKYTAALWFPTIPRAIIKQKDGEEFFAKTNDNTTGGVGLLDTDNLFNDNEVSILGNTKALTMVTDKTDIGTWAGRRAYWEAFHLDISEIKYTRYKDNEIVSFPSYITFDEEGNPIQHDIEAETIKLTPYETATRPPEKPNPGEANLLYLGETYPESGLRIISNEQDETENIIVSVVFVQNLEGAEVEVRNITKGEILYTLQEDNIYNCSQGDKIDYRIKRDRCATVTGTLTVNNSTSIYTELYENAYNEYEKKRIIDKLSQYNKDDVTVWIVDTDFHLFTPESKGNGASDTFDNTVPVLEHNIGVVNDLVNEINKKEDCPNVSVIALNGDFCGYADENQLCNVTQDQIINNIKNVYDRLKDCTSPFMGIPGNHDIYGGGNDTSKALLLQQNYIPEKLHQALIDNNPHKSKFTYDYDTKYTCNSIFDTEKIRFVFFDKFIPEVVCRYNFHSGVGGGASLVNSTTGPCYGGETLGQARDEKGNYISPTDVQQVMSDIMDETKIFINDILTHDLGDRKIVLLTHGCMCGFKVNMSWPSNPEAGITAGSKTIDTRLTPMLYDREHYPYPKDAKFYSGVLSYATAFWLGHEQFSKNTKYDTNDIWENGWYEYQYEGPDWRDWMDYIGLCLSNNNNNRILPDRILVNCFGHAHTDNQATDGYNILYVSTQYAGTQKSGNDDSLIGFGDHRHYNQYDNFEGPYHTTGSITETAFDIYVYEHSTGNINVIRYGNGCDRYFTYHHDAYCKWSLDRKLAPKVNITDITINKPEMLTIYIANLDGSSKNPDSQIILSKDIMMVNAPHQIQHVVYKEWYICRVDKLTNATLYLTPTDDDVDQNGNSVSHFDPKLDPSSILNKVQIPLMLTTNKKYWYSIYRGDVFLKSGTFVNSNDTVINL